MIYEQKKLKEQKEIKNKNENKSEYRWTSRSSEEYRINIIEISSARG